MTCAKQKVVAILTAKSGQKFYGENSCLNPQEVCPRDIAGCKTGEGYEMCKDICKQVSHAEVAAIKAAGTSSKGGVIELYGHTYACDSCKFCAKENGVIKIVIGG
ncbi:MAG TPA: hypothetical protein DDW91_02985 [Shewanella frigidimarina]|nr:hypothetical protein [Shewanella frigidimarina]